jgi:hypothetical protein
MIVRVGGGPVLVLCIERSCGGLSRAWTTLSFGHITPRVLGFSWCGLKTSIAF